MAFLENSSKQLIVDTNPRASLLQREGGQTVFQSILDQFYPDPRPGGRKDSKESKKNLRDKKQPSKI